MGSGLLAASLVAGGLTGAPRVAAAASSPYAVPAPPLIVSVAPVAGAGHAAAVTGSVDPEGLTTSVRFEYGVDLSEVEPGASGPSYTELTPTETLPADFATHVVSASLAGLVPDALYHVRMIAANSAGTVRGPDRTFRTAADPAPAAPVLGRSVDLRLVAGRALIRLPGGRAPHLRAAAAARRGVVPPAGTGFFPLTQPLSLPMGTVIDALHGKLALTAATGHGARTQTGIFSGAVFRLGQAVRGPRRGQVRLALVEGAFPGAPSFAECATDQAAGGVPAAGGAGPARSAKLSPKILQTLHAHDNHGNFRTVGHHASATVRGTTWILSERCAGTYVAVRRGVVAVFVDATRRTVIVRAGGHYLAR